MSATKRVIEVLRISTDMQDLQRQRDDLERNRAAHNLTVARTVELTGLSGRKVLSNSEMQLVLRDLKDPAIDGISITALDRFSGWSATATTASWTLFQGHRAR